MPPSRESLDILWSQHDRQYPSAGTWQEAMKQALMAWATPDRAEVRKKLDAIMVSFWNRVIAGEHPQVPETVDALTDALCGKETAWCRHIVRQDGHWVALVGTAYQVLEGEMQAWTVCPLCAAPRPSGE